MLNDIPWICLPLTHTATTLICGQLKPIPLCSWFKVKFLASFSRGPYSRNIGLCCKLSGRAYFFFSLHCMLYRVKRTLNSVLSIAASSTYLGFVSDALVIFFRVSFHIVCKIIMEMSWSLLGMPNI